MNNAIESIQQIHELALVQHLDTYTENILLVPGPPERVLWTDFDIAVSFRDQSELTAKDKERMDFELEIVKSLGELLVWHPYCSSMFFMAADKYLGRRPWARVA